MPARKNTWGEGKEEGRRRGDREEGREGEKEEGRRRGAEKRGRREGWKGWKEKRRRRERRGISQCSSHDVLLLSFLFKESNPGSIQPRLRH